MPAYKRAERGVPAASEMDQILYRCEEAAKVMSLSRTAVFNLIRSGDLDSIQIGGRRRIPRRSIEDYVSRRLAG